MMLPKIQRTASGSTVVPYWELNGDRLSKSGDCRSATDRTAAQITDDDCIVTQFGNAPTIRFHNVIKDQFNVYVHVNGTEVIREPNNTALAGSFTLDLQDGDNVVKVRLASKTGTHFSERYSNDWFHYKVQTDVLVSNLGKRSRSSSQGFSTASHVAAQFTTGSNPRGYTVSKVRLPIAIETADVSPVVSIYSDDSGDPGASIKVLTNPGTFNVSTTETTEVEFDAGDYELEPGTYWIVIEKPAGSDEIRVDFTSDDSEDGGGAPGWSISNDSKFSSDSGASFDSLGGVLTGNTLQFAVRGTVGPADATLSALTLKDASDNAVALDPTFASDTTSYYYAAVANSVSADQGGADGERQQRRPSSTWTTAT